MTSITLNHITKVEGHASLNLEIDNGKIIKCELKATEGARFFEGLVLGRNFEDVPEIVSRICGICSCGHTVASILAIERALGIEVSEQTKLLRELLTLGERVRSHATHLYFLALPDYLGYESAIEMAPEYKKEIEKALKLIEIGNEIVLNVGGRKMHPHTPVIGGFTTVPKPEQKEKLLREVKEAKKYAIETVELFSKLNYPKFRRDTDYISLKQLDSFPLIEGTIISMNGLNIEQDKYADYFKEYFELYSNAKFAVKEEKEYCTGALARVNNNLKLLSNECQKLIKKFKLEFPTNNPFMNNVAQALEILHWIERAIQILEKEFVFEGLPKYAVKAGKGIGAVEVPRGILFHEYEIDENGTIKKCNIITPTVQNLRNMQEDIKAYVPELLEKEDDKDKIALEIEKLIRSYDPCFSCSVHFLKVKWKEKKKKKSKLK